MVAKGLLRLAYSFGRTYITGPLDLSAFLFLYQCAHEVTESVDDVLDTSEDVFHG